MTDAAGRARPDRVPAPPPTGPTPSMLAYAFGERIAPPAGTLGGKTIPCSGRDVDSDELAVTMLHVALWDLARRERISLAAPRSPSARTLIRPAMRAPLDGEVPASLEYRLFRVARSTPSDVDISELVAGLFPRDLDDPFAEVFSLENEAMLRAGLMRLDAEGRVVTGGAAAQPNQLVWLCERVAQHIVAFTTMRAEWGLGREADVEAFDAVHAAIRSGIESRQARAARA